MLVQDESPICYSELIRFEIFDFLFFFRRIP